MVQKHSCTLRFHTTIVLGVVPQHSCSCVGPTYWLSLSTGLWLKGYWSSLRTWLWPRLLAFPLSVLALAQGYWLSRFVPTDYWLSRFVLAFTGVTGFPKVLASTCFPKVLAFTWVTDFPEVLAFNRVTGFS